MTYDPATGESRPVNPNIAGDQIPGAKRQPFSAAKPYKAPSRPDVLGSPKWHDEAAQQYRGDSFFSGAAVSHSAVVDSIDRLDHLNRTRDPRVTDAAHAELVAKQAEQAVKRLESRLEEIRRRNQEKIASTDHIINDFLGIARDDSHGAEIRARLSNMSDDDRRAAIAKAAQEGDRHVMAAIMHGPSFLTGVSAEERSKMVDNYRRRHAPHLATELDAVRRSAEKLEAAYQEAPRFIRQHYINLSHTPATRKADEAKASYEAAMSRL